MRFAFWLIVMRSFKIKNKELAEILVGSTPSFPKYASQIINLVNRNAQGTRPIVVGQLSDLIKECPYKDFSKWKEWYLKKQPNAINKATDKIFEKLLEMKAAINTIDKKLIRAWVEDLVLNKTFTGLRFQEAILKKIAELEKKNYRLANVKEESKGIDGFMGNTPVSIKPVSYKTKPELLESIQARIVFYEKKKDGIQIIL